MIAIGSDHGGYKLKEEIIKYLKEKNIEVKDFGTDSELRMDYPIIAKDVAEAISKNECETGILICRTGFGMCMVANKFKGVRCAPCYTEEVAKLAKSHNNINILALPADFVTTNEAICILRTWLATDFSGERHSERLKMIEEIEKENMK